MEIYIEGAGFLMTTCTKEGACVGAPSLKSSDGAGTGSIGNVINNLLKKN